jgi:tetratricopeptide (TPR) repeat protein
VHHALRDPLVVEVRHLLAEVEVLHQRRARARPPSASRRCGPTERARILNLAGDLCFDANQRERALIYYDQAIDIYLALGMYASVAAVCQKLVRLSPSVVRARCTLAWMAIARGQAREARERIAEYASPAVPQTDHSLARGHLRMMAEVADSPDVLQAVADALSLLGDDGARSAPTRRRRAARCPGASCRRSRSAAGRW